MLIFLLFLGLLFSVFAVVLCKYSLNFSSPFPILLSIRTGCKIGIIDFSAMQALYFSFLLGIVGIYFTVLSVLLNARPELSIGNYFFYVKNNLLLFLSVFTFLIALLNLIIPYLNIEKKVGFNFQIFSVFELIFFTFFLFRTLFYIENSSLCAKLYKKVLFDKKDSIDYDDISSLATEAREKLKEVRPLSIAQASRISGVNPADISILAVYIEQGKIARVGNE